MAGLEVLADRAPAHEPGAEGHRRRQVGVQASAAGAVPDVDRDPQHRDPYSVTHDHARVPAVNRGRVAGSAEPDDRARRLDAAIRRLGPDQAEYRAELLVGQRLLTHDQAERREQNAGLRRNPDPGPAGDPRGALADRLAVEAAVPERVGPNPLPAPNRQQRLLLPLQLPD